MIRTLYSIINKLGLICNICIICNMIVTYFSIHTYLFSKGSKKKIYMQLIFNFFFHLLMFVRYTLVNKYLTAST